MMKPAASFPVTRLLLAALLCLLAVPEARASKADHVVEVIDLLPESIKREEVLSPLSLELYSLVAMTSIDPQLVRQLRWAEPDPARDACLDPAGLERIASRALSGGSRSAVELYMAQIDRGTRLLSEQKAVEALEALTDARQLLPCIGAVVTVDQLRPLFLQSALARHAKGEKGLKFALIELVTVDPDFQLDGSYPDAVRSALEEARGWVGRNKPVPLDFTGLEDPVYIDGVHVQSLEAVMPGPHVVQVKGPAGEVRTALRTIEPAGKPIPVTALIGSGLLSSEEARTDLTKRLRTLELTPAQRGALDRFLAERGMQRLIFAVKPNRDLGAMARVYVIGQGLIELGSKGLLAGAVEVDVRVGMGRTLVDGVISDPGLALNINLVRRFGTRFVAGIFTKLFNDNTFIDCDTVDPGQQYGVYASYQLPITRHVYLAPSAGWQVGHGAPWVLYCGWEGLGQTLNCSDTLLPDRVQTTVHTWGTGPMGRLELIYGRKNTQASWGLNAGIQAQYNLFNRVPADQVGSIDGTAVNFSYVLEPGTTPPRTFRVDALLGVSMLF